MPEPATTAPTVQMSADEIRKTLNTPFRAIAEADVESYRQRVAQRQERLGWAPAIGCGAGIVALAGIVGNVSSPDTALTALTWPLAIFSVGLASSLLSLHLNALALEVVSTGQWKFEQIRLDLLEIFEEGSALAVGVTVENREERLAKANAITTKTSPVIERKEKLSKDLKLAKLQDLVASWLNGVAIGAIALGLTVLLVGHARGDIRLERPAPAATVQQPAPPIHRQHP